MSNMTSDADDWRWWWDRGTGEGGEGVWYRDDFLTIDAGMLWRIRWGLMNVIYIYTPEWQWDGASQFAHVFSWFVFRRKFWWRWMMMIIRMSEHVWAVLNLFRISHLQIFDLSFCPVPRFVYWKPLWLVSPHQCSGKSYFDWWSWQPFVMFFLNVYVCLLTWRWIASS